MSTSSLNKGEDTQQSRIRQKRPKTQILDSKKPKNHSLPLPCSSQAFTTTCSRHCLIAPDDRSEGQSGEAQRDELVITLRWWSKAWILCKNSPEQSPELHPSPEGWHPSSQFFSLGGERIFLLSMLGLKATMM